MVKLTLELIQARIIISFNDIEIANFKEAGNFILNENIERVYYNRGITRARQSSESAVQQHIRKVEMIEEYLVIDISLEIFAGEVLIVPDGDTF